MRLTLADLIQIASPLTRVCQLWPRSDGAHDYLEHAVRYIEARDRWSLKHVKREQIGKKPGLKKIDHIIEGYNTGPVSIDECQSDPYWMRQNDKSTKENRVTINYIQRNSLEINRHHDHFRSQSSSQAPKRLLPKSRVQAAPEGA